MSKIIVVGGLSAGPSAAAKARREDENAEIILFEKSEDVSYATCGIPYALSGHIPSRDNLIVTDADLLRDRFNIDVRLDEEVTLVNAEDKSINTKKGTYSYDKLVFATGARAFVPPVQNLNDAENWSTCRSLSDFDNIMHHIKTDEVKHVTVMGAGLIGIEVAENLIKAGKSVTVIEGGERILPMWQAKFSAFAENILEDNHIEIIKETFVKSVEVSNGKITGIQISEGQILPTEYLIMSVGIKPNTELLSNIGAKTLRNGALIVDEQMQTSLPGIYAAGDNASIKNMQTNEADYFPLGTHSNKGGRAAGSNAAGGKKYILGGYKTAIIQVFDYTLARTGMGAKDLELAGIPFKRTLIVANSTPSYYPNPEDLIVETYYDANNLTLLGAELFGKHGVDKRVDVLSTAIFAKLKITDLSQLDLAYAPPYSPAKDPIIVNAYVAENSLENSYKEIDAEELRDRLLNYEDLQIIDVRKPSEIIDDMVPTAINIELDTLRNHLYLLDKSKKTVVYCAKGLRGYIGFKILQHAGFNELYNLAGGHKVWEMYTRQFPVMAAEEF